MSFPSSRLLEVRIDAHGSKGFFKFTPKFYRFFFSFIFIIDKIQWRIKIEEFLINSQIDYKYNSRAMASPSPLLNLHVAAPIEGGFKGLQSKPSAQWLPDTNRLLWKFTELSQHSEGNGVGSLKARVELENGPGTQGTIFTQFNCEGTTLSGVEFELVGSGYRLSLVKRRFVSGKNFSSNKNAIFFLL